MKKWAIDIDGVITANPQALSWLTYHLCKNENSNYVYILTWRNGGDPKRVEETIADLKGFNISYHELIMPPKKYNLRVASYWKISQLHKLGVDIWLDDEIKTYERDYKINLKKLLPNVARIWI